MLIDDREEQHHTPRHSDRELESVASIISGKEPLGVFSTLRAWYICQCHSSRNLARFAVFTHHCSQRQARRLPLARYRHPACGVSILAVGVAKAPRGMVS